MKYALKNGIILDGSEHMHPITNKIIIIENKKIKEIVDENTMIENMEIVDLKGQYIMPGLINMHVHLPSSGKPTKKQMDVKKLVKIVTSTSFTRKIAQKLCENYAQIQLYSGVTTIRTMGGVLNLDSLIRNRINNREIIGPRILAANMAISVPKGHMAGSLAYEATTCEEVRDYVRKIALDQPDVIKLMITGGVLDAKVKGEPGELKMAPELVKVACEEAHRLGLKVAAHVESPCGVQVALENGVDTIEHGACPSDEIIRLFKERKAAHIATLSPALPFALFDPKVSHISEIEQYNGQLVFEGIIECANQCLKNNIPVGLGTDTGCPYITQYDMWREVNYFQKYCHVSNAFALYTATLGNAKIAGIDSITGSIEVGKDADLIVTQKNPLESLEALRNISMVIARGNLIVEPHVKKMSQVELELDKYI